ncbi:MAG: dihydrodipicolinate synthase family protein [Eubacteriales bacterium]|nr:dihydrodipicolinate synthase family protein [Eubacteriales bacterium]
MSNANCKYRGIFPAFYAPYTASGEVSTELAKSFALHLAEQGVHGLYVGGSSGECIYQSLAERKAVLEAVVEAVGSDLTIIAHVACNNTADSCELARHAESLGVAAIAAIPPIYFRLGRQAIAKYWSEISAAASQTDFFIYNIPQLAGVALDPELLQLMLENPRLRGVKNSSMPVIDIANFLQIGRAKRPDFTVFNGPDEQLYSGLVAGATGGIGGTYAAFPELYLALYQAAVSGQGDLAGKLQVAANQYISQLVSYDGNLYAVAKALIKARCGIDLGSVRAPLPGLSTADQERLSELYQLVAAIKSEFSL